MNKAFFRTFAGGLAATLFVAFAGCSGVQRLTPGAAGAPGAAWGRRATPSCTGFTTYSGTGGTKVTFADKAGQTLPSYIFVTNGASYLSAKTGKMNAWHQKKTLSPSQYEYPLACFEKTPFVLPPGSGIRVYISYGQLLVGSTSSTGWQSLLPECCEKPNDPTGYVNPNYNVLWDYWEYSSSGTGINLDTTQVDGFALPIAIAVTNPKPGNPTLIGTKSYAGVVQAFAAKTQRLWNTLSAYGTAGPFKGKLLRIMSPARATDVIGNTPGKSSGTTKNPAFPAGLFYNANYFKHPGGYLGYLTTYYAAAAPGKPQYKKIVFVPYQTEYPSFPTGPACNEYKAGLNGGSTVCPTYYAYYAGGAFTFSLATSPSGQKGYPATVSLPLADFAQIMDCGGNSHYQTCGSGIWNAVSVESPNAIGSSATLAQQVTFYLYKALAVDLTRGVAGQLGTHPILPCSSAKSCQASFSPAVPVYGSYNYYQNPNVVSKVPTLFCGYCLLLHQNFYGGKAYASAYDDYMEQSTDTTSTASSKITVTVQPMTL